MKYLFLLFISIGFISCWNGTSSGKNLDSNQSEDSLLIIKMIDERESAMINKDIDKVMDQFSDQATWINSQGYFFEGKTEVQRFHDYLAGNDTLDYFYQAGKPRIRILGKDNALAYYSWKMFWFKKSDNQDTVKREIGLMTLSANRINNQWKWVAVTNQYTPWFYDEIAPVVIE